MAEQARLFLLSVAMGAAIGCVYDVFRILRATAPHPGFLVQLEDVLYWVVASFGMFIFVMNENDGEMRAFFVAGAALGMATYFMTLSPAVLRVSVATITFMKKALAKAAEILLFPFALLLRLLAVPAGLVGRRLALAKKPAKECLQKAGRYVRMKRVKLLRNARVIFRKV